MAECCEIEGCGVYPKWTVGGWNVCGSHVTRALGEMNTRVIVEPFAPRSRKPKEQQPDAD